MPCDPVRFADISPEIFQNLRDSLAREKIMVRPGTSGTISGVRITASFSWDGANSLTVQVIDKPFLASCNMVNSKLEEFVVKAGGWRI